MRQATWAAALVLLGAALAGCRDATVDRNPTSVLGGTGQADATLTDAQGQTIPAPPAPHGARPRTARTAGDTALAVWIADTHVMASTWTHAAGWTLPQPLERIYGESSDAQLASNRQGQAIAVWQHRVGNVHSLRFSNYGPDGWSLPDVVPGALPRPDVAGALPDQGAVQLQMDAQGQVVARWASGFHPNETQSARYTRGVGWSRPATEAVASAPSASPAPRAASSAP